MTTSVATTPGSTPDNYKWKAFGTVGMALFVMVMDFSITFLALSTIAEEFEVTLRAVTWVAIVSSLTVSAIMLPLGRVSDLTGRKRFHITGMVLFVAGSLLAAAAPSLGVLIGARVVMAIGGAMGQAVVMAIITAVFPANERGKGLGMLTTAVALGATAGPIVAGPMLQFFGWRSLFIFLAVPTIIAIVLAIRILDDEKIGTTKRVAGGRYDWPGAFLSASALALLIVTVSNPFGFDWGSIQIVGGGGSHRSAICGADLVGAEVQQPDHGPAILQKPDIRFLNADAAARLHRLISDIFPDADLRSELPWP